MEKLKEVLQNAERLKEHGSGTQDPEDEALHLAEITLELLIEALKILAEPK